MAFVFKKICVVGLGYIGLPTAAMFASRKVQVVGLEVNEAVATNRHQSRYDNQDCKALFVIP